MKGHRDFNPNRIGSGHGFNKGRKFSETWKRNISEGQKGKIIPDEQKKRIAESLSKTLKELCKNPEYKEKILKRLLKGFLKRPTSLEKKFIDFIEKNNLPYKYVGDGSVLIGYKNPDFINVNGKKICIEVANKIEKSIERKGRSYHSWQEYELQRIQHFKKYGWDCIVIWEDELNSLTGNDNSEHFSSTLAKLFP
jgi:hypothetical protein